MDILSYLSALIQTRKTVGIVGLGTVLKLKTPGRFDAETHSFVPPSYRLDFTTELKEEVSLAAFISKKRNVSTDTALYFINEFSTALQQQLNEGKEIQFGDLGTLRKTADEFVFSPAAEQNYGFDFYGLPPVREEQETPVEEIISETPEVEDTVAAIHEPAPPVERTGEDAQKEEVKATEPEPVEPELVEAGATEPEAAEAEATEREAAEPELAEPEPAEAESPAALSETSPLTTGSTTQAEEITTPQESPTLASVAAENEQLEENPGDGAEKLQEEIESLNFYRAKLPYLKENGPADDEVIHKLNDPEAEPAKVNLMGENRFIESNIPYAPLPLQEGKVFPAYLKIILVAIIILLMMSALYLFKPEWFSGITGNHDGIATQNVPAATAPAETIVPADSTNLTDSTVYPPEATGIQSGDTTTTKSRTPAVNQGSSRAATSGAASLPPDAVDSNTVYEVIGASMHDQKEADGFIAQMKKSGINAKVVTNMSGKRLKISIATLKDEKSANLERERLTQKLKIPGIYIYRNKQ